MPDPITIGLGGLAVLNAINQSRQQGAANDATNRAIGLAEESFDAREPLRALGIQRATAGVPLRPDLSAGFADTSNPFFRPAAPLDFGGFNPSPVLDTDRAAQPRDRRPSSPGAGNGTSLGALQDFLDQNAPEPIHRGGGQGVGERQPTGNVGSLPPGTPAIGLGRPQIQPPRRGGAIALPNTFI